MRVVTAAKAWAGAVGAVVTAVGVALVDDFVTADEAGQIVVAVIGAVGTLYAVYRTPRTKTVVKDEF